MTQVIGPLLPPDLSSCDREPIHIPGSIQPHGVLVALEATDRTIVHVSTNSAQWLQQDAGQLVGRSFDSLLTRDSVGLLSECMVECTETTSSLRTLQFAPKNRDPFACCASAHRSNDLTIVELERISSPAVVDDANALTLIGKCRIANRRLGWCESVEELCQVVTRELCFLTGYDRIMVYQFDDEWNGAVVAEYRVECLEPYLGLHYPATDIPAMARAMFLANGLRVIPDAQYHPVPLFPLADPRTGRPLDLSRAQLRSVSPIHLEYLRNMEVLASLTISLVVDGKLWGLIACHHRSPRYLSPALREICELFGQSVSMQLTERLQAAGKKVTEQSKEVLSRLTERVRDSGSIMQALLADEHDLLSLTNSQGAILWRDGEALPVGVVPPVDIISRFEHWLANTTSEPIFFTDCLAKHFQGTEAYADVASGVLALALARSPDVYIFWFRPEVITMVDWAGDPNKSIEPDSKDGRVHPRRSFARWKKSVRNRSLPWLDVEVEAVRKLQAILQQRLAANAEQLSHFMPICAWCKQVRSDQNYWQQVEEFVGQHSDIRFTHGICPECFAEQEARLR
jgi:two-component system, chemotaxis family, sensor kinase Cph1